MYSSVYIAEIIILYTISERLYPNCADTNRQTSDLEKKTSPNMHSAAVTRLQTSDILLVSDTTEQQISVSHKFILTHNVCMYCRILCYFGIFEKMLNLSKFKIIRKCKTSLLEQSQFYQIFSEIALSLFYVRLRL